MKTLQYILVGALAIGLFFLVKETYRAQQSEKSLKKDATLRSDSIKMYRMRESIESKHTQFWQNLYRQSRDSFEIEKKNVKVKYVYYEQPTKVDLSTDHKRDSIIDKIVK